MIKSGHYLLIVFVAFFGFWGCVSSTHTTGPRVISSYAKEQKLDLLYFKEGYILERNGDLIEAGHYYKMSLFIEPNNPLAHDSLRRVQEILYTKADQYYQEGLRNHQDGKEDLAEANYFAALKYRPDHAEARQILVPIIRAEVFYQKGLEYFQKDRKTTAERYFLQALATWPEHWAALKMLVPLLQKEQYEKEEREELSRQKLFNGQEFFPLNDKKNEDISERREKWKNMAEAVQNFNAGLYHFQAGDYVKALSAFQESIQSGLSAQACTQYIVESFFRQGLARFHKKEYVYAKKEFAESLRYDPSCKRCKYYLNKCEEMDSAVFYSQALQLYEQKKYLETVAVLKKTFKNHPDDAKALELAALCHLQEGKRLYEMKDYPAAQKEFENALRYDKTCEKCLMYLKEIDEFYRHYKEDHYNKGLAFLAKKELIKAIQEWEMVYAIDSDYKQVKKNLFAARELRQKLEKIKKSKP